jgi:hypothetical protein
MNYFFAYDIGPSTSYNRFCKFTETDKIITAVNYFYVTSDPYAYALVKH